MNFQINKNFWLNIFSLVVLLEVLSFFSYLYPFFLSLVYILIVIGVLILSLKNISFGILAVFLELVIGSQGYLFSLSLEGFDLSLRIGLWLVVMSVWFWQVFKRPNYLFDKIRQNYQFFIAYLLILIFIGWGLINGLWQGHEFANVFFDFNGWLYFLLVFPMLYFDKIYINYLWHIFTVGCSWLFIKTTLVVYIFSHRFVITDDLYSWLRDFRLAEITFAGGNFWRVFMQSQVMSLICLFIIVAWLYWQPTSLKILWEKYKSVWLLGLASLTAVLFSYSRSFWLGGVMGGLAFLIFLILYKNFNFKKVLISFGIFIATTISALLFILVVINFPIPFVSPDISNLVGSRLQGSASEAAGSSRLTLLKPLNKKIGEHFFLGDGFGSSITYISSDPRIISQTPGSSGEYTTYAFEWGWHDILLKLGLFGILAYIYLLFVIFKQGFVLKNYEPFFIGVLPLIFVNLTTPYLNHPLGIGLIIIAAYLTWK